MNILQRFVNFLTEEDEAFTELGGAHRGMTFSGTVGRACGFAGGKPHWWGPVLRVLIDGQPWFGWGHCARAAAEEAQQP